MVRSSDVSCNIDQLIYRFNKHPTNVPEGSFSSVESDRCTLKFIRKCKGSVVARVILKEKNEVEDLC